MKLFESYTGFIQDLFGEVVTHEGEERYLQSIASIPRPQLLIFAASLCLSEVDNGGFLQLFHNSTGILIPEAIVGLRSIGMTMLAETFEQAAAILGPVFPRESEARIEAIFAASQLSEYELERITRRAEMPYLAMVQAAENLPFDQLASMMYELQETENGGFEAAATAYVNNIPPTDY